MSNLTELENRLRDAEHSVGLYTDNANLMKGKADEMRDKLRALDQEAEADKKRLMQPVLREEDDFVRATKEFERAKAKFMQAEAEFRKAEETYERERADTQKITEEQERSILHNAKKHETERRKLETDIDRFEHEERTYRMQVENARRDVELLRKRLEEARRQEMEQLRRSAANTNARPINGRMSGRDVGSYLSTQRAANNNHAPSAYRRAA